ncbi:hypothetical protein IEQ34_014735 [Dendrobium chrysotoxum]|uniref:Secreted protein n=1 Tax=Dendrobium chrysotoxum TaxID=161865 RepID=A0AAV7GMU5_DENCH|nr:hypothetical protein IEQ34_014735 [Dendrobium chrysotoxum]
MTADACPLLMLPLPPLLCSCAADATTSSPAKSRRTGSGRVNLATRAGRVRPVLVFNSIGRIGFINAGATKL